MVIVEVVIDEDFEKPETEIENFESMKVPKCPQYCHADFPLVNNLDDINEKHKNDLRVQAMFKRPRHNIRSVFKIS